MGLKTGKRARQAIAASTGPTPVISGSMRERKKRPVFGLRRHDEKDRLAGDRFHFERHPLNPSRSRTTIIVLVIDAISLTGPSPMA